MNTDKLKKAGADKLVPFLEDEDWRIVTGETIKASIYAWAVRHEARKAQVSVKRLLAGETLTRKDISRLFGVAQGLSYLIARGIKHGVESAGNVVEAHHRIEEKQRQKREEKSDEAAAERMADRLRRARAEQATSEAAARAGSPPPPPPPRHRADRA